MRRRGRSFNYAPQYRGERKVGFRLWYRQPDGTFGITTDVGKRFASH
jgi:hypothetical protein